MERIPIFYDEDCGICRTLLAGILTWDHKRALRPVPLGSPEADHILGSMTDAERNASWHLDGPSGLRSAGAAFPDLFEILRGAGPLAALARRAPGLSERGYRLIADNRSHLSPLVPAPVGDRADALIASRR